LVLGSGLRALERSFEVKNRPAEDLAAEDALAALRAAAPESVHLEVEQGDRVVE
jgi:hypothetical protein